MNTLEYTNISQKANNKLRGHLVRIGGRADQIFEYKNCTVTDINLIDGGYGKIKKMPLLSKPISLIYFMLSMIRQEIRFYKQGYSYPRDRKSIILDSHNAFFCSNLKQKFDGVISSNIIEHSPNPIWLLLNLHYLAKEDSYQLHAIPHYKYTFDKWRDPTSIEHIIQDFENLTDKDDSTHNADYIRSAIEKDGWQKQYHKTHPISYPYIHFHVYDENNVRQLMDMMFEDVTVDVLKSDRFSDNLVLFKNTLKDSFKNKYKKLIDRYKNSP